MRHSKKPPKPFRSSDKNGKPARGSFSAGGKRVSSEKRFYNAPVKRDSSEKSEYATSEKRASAGKSFPKRRGGAPGKPSYRIAEKSPSSEKTYYAPKRSPVDSSSFGSEERRPPIEKKSYGKSAFRKTVDRPAFGHKSVAGKPSFGKPAFAKKPFSKPAHGPASVPRTDNAAPARRNDPWQQPEKTHSESIFLWGIHAVRAAWLNPQRRCYRLWLTEAGQKNFTAFAAEAKDQLLKRPDAKQVDRQTLDRLIPPGSVHQGIVLEAAPLHQPSLHELISANPPPDLLLILDQVTDPHNVGAILRSAEAFGAGGVIMTERNSPEATGVLAKTASGAVEHIPVINVVNLSRALDELHEAGYWSVGLAEEGAKDLGALDLTGRTVLLLGAEGQGLRQLTRKKCHELARLPTSGPIGSLNVSNAAAVALYEVKRQRKA